MTDKEYIKFKPKNPVWTEYGIDWNYHSRIPGMVEFHFEGDKVIQVQSMDKTEVLRKRMKRKTKWWIITLIVLSFYAQVELTRYILIFPDFQELPMWRRIAEIAATWISPIALIIFKAMRLW